MNPKKISPALLAAVTLAALLVAACGDGSASSGAGSRTDAAFIADMTAHHEGAIDMAKLARKNAEHVEIRTLAGTIVSAQQAEITTMGAVRNDMDAMGTDDGAHMGMSRHAMGMGMDMGALERAKPFDKAFIDAMVPHHRGAVAMARAELAKGTRPALRKMAEDVIRAQSKEIARRKQWRKARYGSARVPGDMSSHSSMDAGR